MENPKKRHLNQLSVYLKKRNMTQSELSKKIGTSQSQISKYVNGYKYPSLPVAIRISNILECSVDDLWKIGVSLSLRGKRNGAA